MSSVSADVLAPLLHGRTVLVTGASGYGVGAGVCDAVHAMGGRLVLNDLDPSGLAHTVARYPGSVGFAGDVSHAGDVGRLFAAATEACGPVTGLVNNAGVGLSRPFHEASEQDFDRVFDVDVRGLWLVSREFTGALIGYGLTGSIVNISSVHARSTMNRYAIYSAAKAAVEGLTRGMAVELGRRGIRCNAIAPGYVHAEQNIALLSTFTDDALAWVDRHTTSEQVLPCLIEPMDCGLAAAFLLSDLSRCITGQTLPVDAGLSARLYNGTLFDPVR